ncbi:MAG: MBL fold metallo-hydrolase [Bacteroidota bacterium]|nr:MBL fold metallo-hydrolase [Bacteroidota bacterium]MDX5431835.1 MBL fold metallo-hydrolase [Bacteroidota bacterium]
MQIGFYGAARVVTGSKHLIETASGLKVLLDCGMFQGGGQDFHELNRHFGFSPHEIDHVILSHAHIDHSGLLPRLVAEGFHGKIWATSATIDLCEIMLMDSAYIQENDLRYVNERRKRRGQEELEPLYTIEDVEKTLPKMRQVPYRQKQQLADDFQFTFYDSGHIIGSAGVFIEVLEGDKTETIFFTGDIGRPGDIILRSPEPFPQANFIICESTYGDRLHDDASLTQSRLLQVVVETCVMKKGKLIIPAFSVDRTQELIYLLDQLESSGKLPHIDVFVDSPLSVKATRVMQDHEEDFNPEILEYIKKDGDAFGFPGLHYITDVKDSKALNHRKEPCIIISASGMAEAGRVKHHIANAIEHEKNCILIVGYASPSSLAGALRRGERIVTIFGQDYHVNAHVEVMDAFSAHGDYEEMLNYLSCQDPSQVNKLFLVHGEYDTQQSFKLKLMEKGFHSIEIPEIGDTYEHP